MFCTRCGNPLAVQDEFCARCGTAVSNERKIDPAAPRPGRERERDEPLETLPATASQNFEAARVATRLDIRKKAAKVSVPIAAMGLIMLAGGATLAALLFFVIASIAYRNLTRHSHLDHQQYFAIEGSSTPRGAPRCLSCGHVGIYSHSRYRSRRTWHDCRKCGTTLYLTRKT